MLKEMKLPEIAENVETAIVLNVMVSEGDHVEKDDPVAEMESEKATFDLPAEVTGTIKEIRIKENDEVKVGQVVMTVETGEDDGGGEAQDHDEREAEGKDRQKQQKETKGGKEEKGTGKEQKEEKTEKAERKEEGEEEEEDDEGEKTGGSKAEEGEVTEVQETGEREEGEGSGEEEEEESPAIGSQGIGEKKEVPASPSVRRLAREVGVDIYQVKGTGLAGRITQEDVKARAREIVKKAGGKTDTGYTLPDFSKWGEVTMEEMDPIRRRTARNMAGSWQNYTACLSVWKGGYHRPRGVQEEVR